MERVYGLYNLIHVKSFEKAYRDSALVLKDQWREDGLSFGRHFNVPDLDNTAMGYVILSRLGHEPDPHVFDRYWQGTFFVTYKVHDKGHPCPNIHALEALALSSHPRKDEFIDATLRFLRSSMIDGNHFQDYWHLSPAYPTCHAIFAFHLTEETLMERCVDFFIDTQRDDGSWGFTSNGNGLGTLEETAFALQGLLYYNQHVTSIDLDPVYRGIEFILDGFPSAHYPEMWWAKVLNSYHNMVESGCIGALLMFRQADRGIDARGVRASLEGGG
jgi:hypothetical protein